MIATEKHYASFSLLTTDCGSSKIKTSYNFTSRTSQKFFPIQMFDLFSCKI